MVSKESIIAGAILILITYTLGLSLVSQAFPATQTSKKLSSAGSIQIQTTAEIGVYYDSGCNYPLTSLSWGTLEPGGSQAIVCHIKNEGNSALTLSIYPSGWYPTEAADYLTLNWNYNGNPISPDAVVQITFTLSVDASIEDITTFSFDVNIVGSS